MKASQSMFDDLQCDESTFAQAVHEAFEKQGIRFATLLGAGLSVPSGIPSDSSLNRYLGYCVWRALRSPTAQGNSWDPRTQRWPELKEVPSDFEPRKQVEELAHTANSGSLQRIYQ